MARAIHLGNPKTGRPTCGQRASYGTEDKQKATCQRCLYIVGYCWAYVDGKYVVVPRAK